MELAVVFRVETTMLELITTRNQSLKSIAMLSWLSSRSIRLRTVLIWFGVPDVENTSVMKVTGMHDIHRVASQNSSSEPTHQSDRFYFVLEDLQKQSRTEEALKHRCFIIFPRKHLKLDGTFQSGLSDRTSITILTIPWPRNKIR